MFKAFRLKIKQMWAFALAAVSLPISYVLAYPCFGGNCAGCPSGGVCLFAIPFLLIIIVIAKLSVKIKKSIKKVNS